MQLPTFSSDIPDVACKQKLINLISFWQLVTVSFYTYIVLLTTLPPPFPIT